MDKQAKCKKCGRRLKSPTSIGRSMGSKCAGITSTSEKSVRVQSRSSHGVAYSKKTPSQVHTPLYGELPKKKQGKRELVHQQREERRRLFETRLPFQCGLVLPARKLLVYTPLEDGSWQEYPSGRAISHERLQQYLVKYRFI